MEKEDPLMRLEREERERKERGKSLKPVMWILAVIAIALGGVLAFVWSSKNSLVKDLEVDKQQLTEQIISLQGDYESLSSDYDSVNAQLDSSKEVTWVRITEVPLFTKWMSMVSHREPVL